MRRLAYAARGLVILVLALGIVGLACGLGLAWRLAQGPLDLGWALPRIEAALNRGHAATRITADGASLAWLGFGGDAASGVELRVEGLLVRDGTRTVARATSLRIDLAPAALFALQLRPRLLEATGLAVQLLRAPDGLVTLDLGGLDIAGPPPDPGTAGAPGTPEPDLAEVMRELARPPAEGPGPVRSALQEAGQLRRVHLVDSVVTMQDRALGGTWRLAVSTLALERQDAGGVVGQAEATLGLGGAEAGLALEATVAPGGGTSLMLTMARTDTAALQRGAPALAAALTAALGAPAGEDAVLDTAVQGTAQLMLTAGLLPRSAAVTVSAGGGRVRLAGASVGFDSLSLAAEARWPKPGWTRPGEAGVSRLKAVLRAPGGAWPTTVTASGAVRLENERLSGTATAALDHLAFADIPGLWPERLGGHVRPWLVKSITTGTARDGAVAVAFNASSTLSDPVLTRIDGSVAADEMSIHWLRPVAPIEHAQALLTIRSPDVLEVALSSARQGGMALSNGTVRVTGLTMRDQFLMLGADASGTVAEAIQLLRHPRLQLLDRKPIPMRNPGGTFTGHLGVFLPLNEDLDFDDVRIAAQVRAKELRLGGLVAGRDLDHGDIQLNATSESLRARGRAAISGIPNDVMVDMDFRNGGPDQVVLSAQGISRAGPQQLAAAGVDTAGILEGGQGAYTARYAARRDGQAELTFTANLRDASMALAGWTKPVGAPADVAAHLVLRNDQMVGVDRLSATAPGLVVEGRVDLVGDRPLLLRLDRLVLGGTEGSGEVRLPDRAGDPVRVRLDGPVLDLNAVLARKPPGAAPEPQAPWTADMRFDRVLLAGDRGLAGVTAHAESADGKVVALRVASTGPEKLNAAITRQAGVRHVKVTAADGGAVLRAMDLIDSVQGGALTIDAAYDDTRPDTPLRGTLELGGFRLRNAPGFGKLLQAITVYGVVEALSGPGLSFRALSMPFEWNGTILDVKDVQVFSASLGLTARGRVDAVRKVIDMQGTVVPLYVINSMLGRIPLLGRLFSAEKGGGLLAINYGLHGPVADPTVSVNPLSALTPGFLRGLFKILD